MPDAVEYAFWDGDENWDAGSRLKWCEAVAATEKKRKEEEEKVVEEGENLKGESGAVLALAAASRDDAEAPCVKARQNTLGFIIAAPKPGRRVDGLPAASISLASSAMLI